MSGGHGGGGGGGDFEEEPEPHENHERYLLTYADMITLLMALFIILFAIGQTDVAKYKQFQTGLQKQFGAPALDGGTGVLDGVQDAPLDDSIVAMSLASPGLVNVNELGTSGQPGETGTGDQDPVEITPDNADRSATTIETVLDSVGLPKSEYEVVVDERGVVIRLATDEVTFGSGSAALVADHTQSIDVVGRVIKLVTNTVIIEGHTDSTPMSGPLTNWELSAMRAASVLRHLEGTYDIDPTRLQIAGYADTRPIAPNETAAGRIRNRRVEIVIAVNTPNTPSRLRPSPVGPVIGNPALPAPVNPLAVTAPAAPVTTEAASGN